MKTQFQAKSSFSLIPCEPRDTKTVPSEVTKLGCYLLCQSLIGHRQLPKEGGTCQASLVERCLRSHRPEFEEDHR